MELKQVILPVAILMAAANVGAATVGVEGSPALDMYWQNPAVQDAPVRYVGTVTFAVDENGDFIATGVSGNDCGIDSLSGDMYCLWGTDQDRISIDPDETDGNLDPFMNFGLAVTDSGAPSIFSFLFSSPIAPTITGMANYYLSLAGSFSNGGAPNPNNGGSIAIAAPNAAGVMQARLNGTTSIAGIGGGASFPASPPGSSTYGAFATSGTFDCASLGGCTSFQSRIAFLLSGGGDVMTLSGTYEIEPVPVPAAVWLMGSALGLLGYLRRRVKA